MFFKELATEFLQGEKVQHPQYIAGNDFADAHGDHHERDGIRCAIGVAEYPRYNYDIGYNWWKRNKPLVFTQGIGTEGSNQGGEAAKENVPDDAAGK